MAELSCERLYMQYQHTRLTMDRAAQPPKSDMGEQWDDEPPAVFDERTTQNLFREVDRSLRNADVVRVVDERTTQNLFREVDRSLRNADVVRVVETEWLAVDAFRRDVEDLLAAFRRRGGRVEYQADTCSTTTSS